MRTALDPALRFHERAVRVDPLGLTMSKATNDESPSQSRDLAARIYVELVARNVEILEGSVKMTASAANLATLSLKLAEAFEQAETEAIAAKAPVTTYKLAGADIAEWSK